MVRGSSDVYKEMIYKSLFETATDSIFLMDENIFLECNKRTLDLFGCKSKSDILGKGPTDFSPEFQASGELSTDVARKRISLALEGKPQLFEWKHSKLEGGEFFAEISLTRIEIDTKNLLLSVVRDITLRKRIESELSDLQEYLQLQINRMPIGLIGIDTASKIVSWNPSAEKIFGYSEEEVLDKKLFDLIVPDSVTAEAESIMQRLLLGDETANNTNQNITKDRSTIICR
ncbi:MAG: PAS domain S-box protein, partial [Bacteroidales bacterium]|nr:PAS domain S-box protein [Bacteroidales bacterium]